MRDDHATIGQKLSEAEHLLSALDEMNEMADLNTMREIENSPSPPGSGSTEEQSRFALSGVDSGQAPFMEGGGAPVVYKVYRRRWFGLIQLVLLNIVVSWDVSTTLSYPPSTSESQELTI